MNNTEWIGKDVLITCNKWFYAPNGDMYNGVWGKLKAIHKTDDLYGFSTRGSQMANYLFEIGDAAIAGCQVHYAILCPQAPNFNGYKGWTFSDAKGELIQYDKPNCIYNANASQTS